MDVIKSPEKPIVSAPERLPEGGRFEHRTESQEKKIEKSIRPVEKQEPLPVATPVASAPNANDYHLRREKQIDDILADGLDKIYLNMNPEEQKRFKQEGEKTAAAINQLLDKAKAGVGKIISLIKRWLGLIPGANRYFLEQEAKIKADRIMKINKSI